MYPDAAVEIWAVCASMYYAPVNNNPHYPTPVLYRGIDKSPPPPEGR